MALYEDILATEKIYLLIMRIIGGLCVFISIITVYLILKHSPKEMRHYKWMLLIQTVSLITKFQGNNFFGLDMKILNTVILALDM